MRKTIHGHADVRCFDKDGKLKWEELGIHNVWHDEGEQYLLSLAFATAYSGYGSPTVATMYIGLDSRASLAEGDTLATINGIEPNVAYGYARLGCVTSGTGVAGQDFVLSQPVAAWQALTKEVTFLAAGGAWAQMKNCFLCTHLTAVTSAQGQRLIMSLALSQPRTLADGESVKVSMYVQISEP